MSRWQDSLLVQPRKPQGTHRHSYLTWGNKDSTTISTYIIYNFIYIYISKIRKEEIYEGHWRTYKEIPCFSWKSCTPNLMVDNFPRYCKIDVLGHPLLDKPGQNQQHTICMFKKKLQRALIDWYWLLFGPPRRLYIWYLKFVANCC